jgi:hypothetical protein
VADFSKDFGMACIAAWNFHQRSPLHGMAATVQHMPCAGYLLGRAAQLRALAQRARNPQNRRYLLRRAAVDTLLAKALERAVKAKPDEAKADTGWLAKAC